MGRLRLLLVMALSAGMLALGPACSEAAKSAPTKRFSSAGHPESHGLAISLDYPEAWNTKADPLAVQSFADPDGSRKCALRVTESEKPLSDWSIASTLTEGFLRQAIPDAKMVRGHWVDGLPTRQYVLSHLRDRGGASIIHVASVYLKTHTIELGCISFGQNVQAAESVYKLAAPQYHAMIRSMSIRAPKDARPGLTYKNYSSANHPKASGLNISLTYPSIYEPKKDGPAYAIQTFASSVDFCTLAAFVLDRHHSPAEMRAYLADMAEQAPANATFLGAEDIGGLPANGIAYSTQIAGEFGVRRSARFTLGSGQYIVQWTCLTLDSPEGSVGEFIDVFVPIYHEIARTIRLQ